MWMPSPALRGAHPSPGSMWVAFPSQSLCVQPPGTLVVCRDLGEPWQASQARCWLQVAASHSTAELFTAAVLGELLRL